MYFRLELSWYKIKYIKYFAKLHNIYKINNKQLNYLIL